MDKIISLTSDRMLKVNNMIIEKMKSEIPLISDIASYILNSGGKRLRPILALASAKLLNYEGPLNDIFLASAIELIHTATLLHDDVVDDSKTRRGYKTANGLWGNQSTILVGDFLFSRAFELMVETKSLDVLKTLSYASCKISEGEIYQLISQNNPQTSKKEYIKIITGKTSELFSAACKAGAIIATNDIKKIYALETYGKNLGIAYQLIDDALDYNADPIKLGKSIGDDFKTGKVSLPIIIAWEASTSEEQKFWNRVIREMDQEKNDFNTAKNIINKYDGLTKTIELANFYAQNAISSLSAFKDSEIKSSFIEAAKFASNRLK